MSVTNTDGPWINPSLSVHYEKAKAVLDQAISQGNVEQHGLKMLKHSCAEDTLRSKYTDKARNIQLPAKIQVRHS